MLDANPSLGARAVQEILAYSSKRTGPAASYVINHAKDWNGGGLHTSTDFGFGLVDATAAVRLAESWTLSHPSQTWGNVQVAASSQVSVNLAIPDNNTTGVSGSFVSGTVGSRLQRVELSLNVTHSWIGDLVVTLTAPSGTTSTLMSCPGQSSTAPFGSSQENINFVFDTVQFWGESGNGTWTVNVSDRSTDDTGILNNFALTLYYEANINNTYVYTNEYTIFAGVSGHIKILSDTNNGIDTINAAAVTAGSVINLNAGATSTIAGQSVTIAASTVIENAIGGDGNDTLIGNSANNVLHGFRGDDLLNGAGGADTLRGGLGNDTYVLGADSDAVTDTSGIDTITSSVSRSLIGFATIEKLVLLTTATNGTGNALANTITGNPSNNVLDGGPGADILIGAAGDDVYVLGAESDTVNDTGGNDTITSTITRSLADFATIENLTLLGTAPSGTGNALSNSITGNAVHNTMAGMAGADTLVGGIGNDTLDGGTGFDTMLEVPVTTLIQSTNCSTKSLRILEAAQTPPTQP